LLVAGAILSACYAPIVTPTQSEVVTEPVASEVVEMPLEIEEPTATERVFVTVSGDYVDDFCSNYCPDSQLVNIDGHFNLDFVVENAADQIEEVALKAEGADKTSVVIGYLNSQGALDGDEVVGSFTMWVDYEDMEKFGVKLTPTPTPELYTVTINAFHDYNGDGIRDDGEPSVEGVIIESSGMKCVTDSAGLCNLLLSVDFNHLDTIAPEKFNYIRLSREEAILVKKGLRVNVTGPIEILIPLNEEILLLPFDSTTSWSVVTYQDRCLEKRVVCNWMGNRENTRDGHTEGMDFGAPAKSPVYYPGTVGTIVAMFEHEGPVIQIVDQAPGWAIRKLDFGHVIPAEGIEIGSEVVGGQLLGYVQYGHVYNQSGIHLGIWLRRHEPLDLFDEYNSMFTKSNDPQPPF